MKTQYEVIVGNIGTVFRGGNAAEARKTYAEYVCASEAPHGRASGETVTLFMNGDIHLEYEPSTDEKE